MTSSRRTLICAAALALAGAAIASPARAVPVNFTGTQQNFDLTLTATGEGVFTGRFTQDEPYSLYLLGPENKFAIGTVTLAPDGFTYNKVPDNPSKTPISLKQTVSISTDPRSIGLPKVDGKFQVPGIGDLGVGAQQINGVLTRTLVSATNLDLDMLNGQTVDFALSEIVIPRTQMIFNDFYNGDPLNGPKYYPNLSPALKLNISGTVKELYLEQDMTKMPTFTPDGPAISGVSTGTFSIPSILNGLLDAKIVVGTIEVTKLENQKLDTDFAVSGRYELSGPPSNMTIKFFGSNNLPFPLDFNSALTLSGGSVYGITSTVDLAASINLAYNFALSMTTPIPEPGSIVLLAIGLMSVCPLMAGRLRRYFKRC